MILQATVKSVIVDDGDLSVGLEGWAKSDPDGTYPRPLGTVNVPSNEQSRKAFYVGRKVTIEVKPA